MSIKGHKSQQALKQKLSGYTEDQSIDPSRYVTVQEMSGRRHALDVLLHGAYQITIIPKTVAAGSNIRKIVCVGHGANKNDIIRLSNGTQFAALSIPDANTIITSVELDVDPTGDTFTIWRHITPSYNADGSLNTTSTPGPVQYNRKTGGITTPTQVIEDLDTPANTRALPVVLHGLDAANITVTANQLDVSLSHVDDSVKIGDGTTLAQVTLTNELKVSDATTHTDLATLDASVNTLLKPASTLTKVTTVDTITNTVTVTGPLTDTQLRATAVPVSVAGVATEGTLATATASVGSIDTKTPALGQALMAASVPVVMASNQSSLPVTLGTSSVVVGKVGIDQTTPGTTNAVQATNFPTTVSTGTGADGASTLRVTLSDHHDGVATPISIRESDGTDFLSAIALAAAQLSSGALAKLRACMSVMMAWDGTNHKELLVDTSGNLKVLPAANPYTGTITTANVTLTTAGTAYRATVSGSAPNSARKRLIVVPSDENTGKMWIGASGVTTSTGLEIIGPDRVQFEMDASDYYVVSDTNTQKIYVLEVV